MRRHTKQDRIMVHMLAALLTVAGCLLCGGMAAGTVADKWETGKEGESEWMSEMSEWLTEEWLDPGADQEKGTEQTDGIEKESASEEISEAVSEGETDPETDSMESESASAEKSEGVSEGEMDPETDNMESEEMSEGVSEGETDPETDSMESESASEEMSEAVSEGEMETDGIEFESTSEEAEDTEHERMSENMSENAEEAESEKISEEAEMIIRGIHYNVSGEEGAYYRDENGRLWLRKGTGLYIRPAEGSAYNQGTALGSAEQDGSLEFCLKKAGENGAVLQESATAWESYYVDGEAPSAVIKAEGILENGILYSASEPAVQILVEPDAKSGLKRASYCVIPCTPDGTWQTRPDECTWYDCGNGQTVWLSEEGVFQIYVRTEDQVGNLAFSGSQPMCVDRTAPEIIVDGVQNHTANNGSVTIRVSCRDENYRSGSFRIALIGLNQGKIPLVQSQKEQADGADVLYYDFPQEKIYDDIYCMKITAEDKAGNKGEEELEFSVNRFGSVYDLSESTRELLSQFYLSAPEDIVFYETNIDYVGESEIYCRCDGTLRTLEQGRDYQVTMQGAEDTWKQYQYTIASSCFSQEGVYELLLTSGDQAANVSDTGMQEKRVVFALDKTSPGCTVSGISSGEIYEKETVNVYVTPYDNMGLSSLRVYCNSEMILEQTSPETDQTVQISLGEDEEWQTVQIYASDLAGNEYWTDEIPVYINQKTDEVPEYQKLELSAKESEAMKKSTDVSGQELENQNQKEQNAAGETDDSEARESGDTYEAPVGKKDDSGSKKLMERILKLSALRLFWPIGTAVFLLTIVVCTLAGSKRKR